jgi:hypothetical protein
MLKTAAHRRSLVSSETPGGRVWLLAAGLALAGCANASIDNQTFAKDASAKDGTSDGTGPDDKNDKKDTGQSSPDNGPAGPCDPFTNSGCPSGKKCTALAKGDSLTIGCGDKGNKAEGNDCSPALSGDEQTGDDCGDGLSCFALKDDPSPTCHRICPISGTAHACPQGSVCRVTLPGISNYASCGSSCRPLEQSGCADSQACYLTSLGAVCWSLPDKPVAIGGNCTGATVNECERGSTCVTGLSSGNKCLAFCSTKGQAPTCSNGTTCTKAPIDEVFLPEPDVGTCR